jgi:hypothetical protein
MIVHVPVSVGELVDKLTILDIKKQQIRDPKKLANVAREFDLLSSLLKTLEIDIEQEYETLCDINQKLWNIEDRIRKKEKLKQYDQQFIDLARSVYYTNDQRAQVKKSINLKVGSELVEEKSYEKY